MPADDLITQVNINSDDFSNDASGRTLIRRWWDIKEAGFFGKDLGVVMMSIDAIPTPENQRKIINNDAFDLKDRLSFIMMISEYLHRKYYAINRGNESDEPDHPAYFYSSFSRIGGEIQVSFWDETVNEQIWMGYGAGGPHEGHFTQREFKLADGPGFRVILKARPGVFASQHVLEPITAVQALLCWPC